MLTDDDVADMQLGVEAAGDTGKDDGIGMVRADQVLSRCGGVDRTHAGGGGNHCEAVILAAHDMQTSFVDDGALLYGGINLAHFLFQRADDGDGGCHASPIG